MKIAKYKQHFNSFGHSAAIVATRKNSCTFFSLLKLIPKDAEFHGLSEYVITFVKTKSDSNGIEYKTSFLDIVLYNIVEY